MSRCIEARQMALKISQLEILSGHHRNQSFLVSQANTCLDNDIFIDYLISFLFSFIDRVILLHLIIDVKR